MFPACQGTPAPPSWGLLRTQAGGSRMPRDLPGRSRRSAAAGKDPGDGSTARCCLGLCFLKEQAGALQGPQLGGVWGTDWPQGGGVALPRSPPHPGHCAAREGRGWVGRAAHHLNCFRKMLRFRLFLESRKVIWKTPRPGVGTCGCTETPVPPPTRPGRPHLLGLLPGGGGHAFLGLGLGEAEEPLNAGEVRLHDLGAQAAQ